MYDLTCGKVSIKEWGNHLLRYYDGCFLDDSLFGLFLYNMVQRHASNSEGNFFLASDQFIGKKPPTVQELQRRILQKNCCYINMLRYFSQNIKGSDNYWHSRTDDLEHGSIIMSVGDMVYLHFSQHCLVLKIGGLICGACCTNLKK